MNKKTLWSILLLLLPLNCLWAQDNYALRTFTTKDGLPHNQVLNVNQDSTGFIWIATWDGLSRYDGYEFKNYYHHPDDSTTIPYFSVYKVLIDRFNKIWVETSVEKNAIYNPPHDNFMIAGPGKSDKIIRLLTVDPSGEVWQFNAVTGLQRYDYQKNEYDDIRETDQLGNDINFEKFKNYKFRFDNRGNIWLLCENSGRPIFLSGNPNDRETVSFRTFTMAGLSPPDPASPAIFTDDTFNPYISPGGNIYLFSIDGLFHPDEESGLVSEIKKPYPTSDFRGAFPFIWSPDQQVLYHYDPKTGRLDSINDLSGNRIFDIFRDKVGNFWMSKLKRSGEGDGLIQAIPTPSFFRHYLTEYDPGGFTNAYFAVLKDRFGNIWAAARNLTYLFKISPDNQVSKVNPLNDKIISKALHPRSFLEDSAGIWIGYYRNLLMYYDFSSGKFSLKYFGHQDQSGVEFTTGFENLIRTKRGLLGSSANQIITYDISKNNILPRLKFDDDKVKPSIYKIKQTSDSSIIACMNFGSVKLFDKNFHEMKSWNAGITSSNVEDVCQGDHDDFWFALLGGGLAHIYRATGKSEIFTTADGLSNNTCYSILKDRRGNLWITTNHGISRFNPETRQFRTFDASDGLKIDEFNSDAAYQAPDGEMFFGGMGGIVSFYPDSLKENELTQPTAPLVITDFKVSGLTHYFNKAIYDMDTVVLSKGDNNFQVTFACLDFQNAEKIRYRYRLSGQNSNWTETGFRQRFVNYANLTPGSYFLEIEASNRNGDWVSDTSLLVEIPPFYYQTLWFRLMVIVSLIGITGLLTIGYISRIRLKAKKKQEELKLESLRGQMNPHFIFNSLNSINYFISRNDRLSANRYIADFSRLIRSILGNLSSDYIPFSQELESLHDYLKLEHLRFSDKFDYSIRLPEGMESSEIMVFPGMVQPFAENAIWHGVRGLEGRKGIIKIEFKWPDNHALQCVVEDDGIGRKLAEQWKSDLPGKTSRGIGIVLERLRIINSLEKTNYRVVMEDPFPEREETGTRVIIDIPVKTSGK